MANAFISVMEKIGHDIKVAFQDVVQYLPAAASIASLIFPAQAATISDVVTGVDVIQKTVVLVEQKYAAMGAAQGTGAQKLADVMSVVEPIVVQILQKANLPSSTDRVQSIVNAVVAVLNAQQATGGAPSA